jgi:uncharacterized membrane protein YphA (DoxX/SURF4 family)
MKRSIGLIILQVAVAIYLLVSGITGLLHSNAGDLAPVVAFLNDILESRTISTILVIVISVGEIIAGVFLVTELFTTDLRVTNLIIFLFVILWVANIVLVDFLGAFTDGSTFRNVNNVLKYLGTLSSHLMVLGALIAVNKKFE